MKASALEITAVASMAGNAVHFMIVGAGGVAGS